MLECARMTDPLIHCLTDEHEKVRLAAIDVLSNYSSEHVMIGLISALYDSSSWVAYRAAEALGYIGDAEAVVPMIEMLKQTRHVAMKIALVKALQQIGDERSEPVLSEMRMDDNADIRDLFTDCKGQEN